MKPLKYSRGIVLALWGGVVVAAAVADMRKVQVGSTVQPQANITGKANVSTSRPERRTWPGMI